MAEDATTLRARSNATDLWSGQPCCYGIEFGGE